MVIMQTWHTFRVGFRFRKEPKQQYEYWIDILHPDQQNFHAPLALVAGDHVPYGHNLSRQWAFAGEEFWLASHLAQWRNMYCLWEPHP